MAALAPLAGELYATPPIPVDFAANPLAAAVPTLVLASCHAVTSGPDRHLYWVYNGMGTTATAITTSVTPPCCFETRNSMALSQGKTALRQRCVLCNQSVSRHMTSAEAISAFNAHAVAFPATHATLNIPLPIGTVAPPGYTSAHGTTAPIVVPPLPIAPPVVPSSSVIPVLPALPALLDPRDTQSAISVNDVSSYQMLTNMVKVNTTSAWSADMEAHQFITGLEHILRSSPVRNEYWTALIQQMIPGSFTLERDWVYINIISQQLSWNQAKAAFTRHYQRSDYMDGRRELYGRCAQAKDETTQEYSRRFQTLATQLMYSDNDSQSIHHYLKGLPPWLHKKMLSHKSNMRTLATVPVHDWDFASLSVTISLAIMFAAEPQVIQRKLDVTPLPLHLKTSALANPETGTFNSDTSDKIGKNNKRKPTQMMLGEDKEKDEHEKDKNPKKRIKKECKYHPSSTTHTTSECRTKGKTRSESSPETGFASAEDKTAPRTTITPPSLPRTNQRTSTNQQQDLSKIQCFNCRKYGHYASVCTQPAAMGQSPNTNRFAASSRRAQRQRAQVSFGEGMEYEEAVVPLTSSTPTRQE
jgi:hypothetical protein